jgi:signal transduction histidine kinase
VHWSRKTLYFALLFLGAYAAVSLSLGRGWALNVFANVVLCLVPLLVNLGLLINAGSIYHRRNSFWTFLAIGCALWSLGQLVWAIGEFENVRLAPGLSIMADLFYLLSVVPMLAGVGVRPHRRNLANALRNGYVDLALLAGGALYLYGFFVLPAGVVSHDLAAYHVHYLELTTAANFGLIVTLYVAWRHACNHWRRIYLHLLGAASLHLFAWLLIRWALLRGVYFSGSLFDLPLIASFLWFGIGGLEAYRLSPVPDESGLRPIDHRSAIRVAIAGIVAMPLLGVWAIFARSSEVVRHFRIDLTLGTIVIGVLLLLLRQNRVDRYRRSLLRATEQSLDKMNRLQTQLVLTEKLASLGELAAGAAHEINNPLTAIFGYADLLLAEAQVSDRVRTAATKIQAQAHRTRSLVDNLLSFARQVSAEKALLDVNALLSSAVHLRRFQLFRRNVTVQLDTEPGLPAVRGDPKLLLQVFYEIISNAADAMEPGGGGRLTIRTRREAASIVIEFADTGPGIERPALVFDPFFTTKAIGQGTGLGLSMCYGIVHEHGGQIFCRNRPEGGALFRIELPAVILPLPLKLLLEPAGKTS